MTSRRRMHEHPAVVYLIGDSTLDVTPGLLDLLRQGHHPLLQAFLSEAHHGLRAEIAALPAPHRLRFPRFSSIQDLIAIQHRDGGDGKRKPLHPALHKALVCCSHLAAFICQVSGKHDVFAQDADVYLAGFCTGALAAAAISSSRHIADLVKLGPHAVRVAFRAAFKAYEVAEIIEADKGGRSSWSLTVANISEDEVQSLITDFSSENGLPNLSRPYISFVAKDLNCITISGPPTILKGFRENQLTGRDGRIGDLEIYVPYHAKHLFTGEDVNSIVDNIPYIEAQSPAEKHQWAEYGSQLPVISASTGVLVQTGSYRDQLRHAVEDILINPVRWDNVITGISYLSRLSSPSSHISLHGIGTSYHTHLQTALDKLNHDKITRSNSIPDPITTPHDLSSSSSSLSNPLRTASGKSKIAIIGMSGRFPEADSPDAFWSLLSQGLDVHKIVPATRWNASTHVDTTGVRKNTSRTPYGCWLSNPAAFDAKFFSVTPREAPQIDPASRLALMTSYEAMENAGMVPGATPSTQKDRVGVVYGVTSNDWMEVNSAQNIDAFFIPGGCRAFIPGRVNYSFKLGGPSFSLDTACSSSMSAIHTACNLLWEGDIDTAIAGGTNVLTNPDYTAGLDRARFLSTTGNCKSFDQSADGYCRAEGVCTVILKRLEDALAEKDPILGVILGVCTNHSAEADSITRPLAAAQKDVFTNILSETSVNPLDVSYIEMHGTGTQAGDPVEMESVTDTFAPAKGPLANRRGKTKPPLYVGTVKANIGHQESAAGVTSLAKVLLMMKHNAIPPHVGIKTKMNVNFPADLDERGVKIASAGMVEWKSENGGSRKAFVNSFSAAGGNSALLIEDAPPLAESPGVETETSTVPSTQIITISAKTPKSLEGNIRSMLKFLEEAKSDHQQLHHSLLLPHLSYTTTARRTHHPLRVAVTASSLQEAQVELQKTLETVAVNSGRPRAPRILFTCTGNGSQYSGMGRLLFETFPSFRSHVLRLDSLIQREGFASIVPYLVGSSTVAADSNASGEEEDAITTQLSTICLEIALSRLWISWGVKPDAVVGHSLGEYAAFAVAGVLSEADAIYLVASRAKLLQDKCVRGSHGMLAIRGAGRERMEEILSSYNSRFKLPANPKQTRHQDQIEIACVNGPEQVVVSGPVDELVKFKNSFINKGLPARTVATLLKVPYAFHSSQVEPILDELETVVCRGVTFRAPTVPVISSLLGTTVAVGDSQVFNPRYLRRHCRETVDFLGAMRVAHTSGLIKAGAGCNSIALEIGPNPITNGMIRTIFPKEASLGEEIITTLASLRQNEDAFSIICPSLCSLYRLGCDINWREYYHSAFPPSYHRVVQLPNYNWDLKDYWIQYVNDWSLRKGDPPLIASSSAAVEKGDTKPSPNMDSITVPRRIIPKLESTSIHKVVQDTRISESNAISIIVETDLTRKDIRPLAQGHRVNKIPLSTPAIYAEIALRLGKHILDKYQPSIEASKSREEIVMAVQEMTIERALVVPDSSSVPFILRSSVSFDPVTSSATCRFSTLLASSSAGEDNNSKYRHHSHCKVVFLSRKESMTSISLDQSEAKSRITALSANDNLSGGQTFRFSNSMIYKMVGSLAQFDLPYRQVQEIVLDSSTMDASSVVKFDPSIFKDLDSSSSDIPSFYTNPAAIDALAQSAGFIMNGNEGADLDKEVFVNHGWKDFRLFERLQSGKKYVTYCFMSERENKKWEGDCIVFDGERPEEGGGKLVAWFGGIHLQGVPRRVLQYILNGEVKGRAEAPFAASTGNPTAGTARLKSVPPPARTTVKLQSKAANVSPQHTPGPQRPPPVVTKTGTSSTTATTAPASLGDNKPKVHGHHQHQVLKILSEETGIPLEELTDQAGQTTLADLGIDSLLQLLIASRLNEELDIHFDSPGFMGITTVADLCRAVAPPLSPEHEQEAEPEPELEPITGSLLEQRPSYPDSSSSSSSPSFPGPVTTTKDTEEEHLNILQILSEETGIPVDELQAQQSTSTLADLGIDSLLQLLIASRLSEELGVHIESSDFLRVSTVQDLCYLITPPSPSSSPASFPSPLSTSSSCSSNGSSSDGKDGLSILSVPSVSSSSAASSPSSPPPESKSSLTGKQHKIPRPITTSRPATSIILHGRPLTASHTLFLLPDGSGRATSYLDMASRLNKLKHISLAVIGLNSPYARHPDEVLGLPISGLLESVIEAYITEIRRRQAGGPYHLGGWSSGGILAYLVAQRLIREGEIVESLLLIDAPCPNPGDCQGLLDPLPDSWYQDCAKAGIFKDFTDGDGNGDGGSGADNLVLKHFRAQIQLFQHEPDSNNSSGLDPLPEGYSPRTSIIWAGESVTFPEGFLLNRDEMEYGKKGLEIYSDESDPARGINFLTKRRPKQGWNAGYWQELMPGPDSIDVSVMRGRDHFSMMRVGENGGGGAEELARWVQQAVGL